MTPRYGLKKRQPLSAPIFLTFSCSRVASSCLRTNIQISERCEGGMPPGFRGAIRPMQRTLRMCRLVHGCAWASRSPPPQALRRHAGYARGSRVWACGRGRERPEASPSNAMAKARVPAAGLGRAPRGPRVG